MRTWADAVVVWSGKGWIAPKGQQTEDLQDREQEISFSWLFLPPESAPLATDRLTISGVLYQVFGDPITANTPKGLHHYEVRIIGVNG